MAILEDGYAELQAHASKTSAENAQLLTDLRAFEEQNAELTRQLAAMDGEVRQADAERRDMSEQLTSTKLVLGGVERSREVTQRDSATAARNVALLSSRVDDLTKERDGLKQQLEFARAKVTQLEGVASSLRTQAAMGVRARAPPALPPADDATDADAGGASGAEPDVTVAALQQKVDEQAAELTQLQRALGTASAERDVALEQQRSQGEALDQLQETVAKQSAVITRLDEERAAAVRRAGT